jgi:cobalt/nickel transport system permease protein
MGMRFNLDAHSSGSSLIHRWQPRQKLMGFSGLIFAFAAVHDLRLVPTMLVVTGGFYAASNLPLSFLLSRLRYPGFFLLGMVLLLPFLSGKR